MNIRTKECEDCNDLQKVLSYIDCTILDIVLKRYNKLIYGTKDCCNDELYNSLVKYKEVITNRLYNCSYPCVPFSSNEILSKARLLAYKTDCSRCPECEEIINFPTGNCLCATLTNTETIEGVIPYRFSYSDCNGQDFVDIPLALQQSTSICVNPDTLVTNFSHTLITYSPCIGDCG